MQEERNSCSFFGTAPTLNDGGSIPTWILIGIHERSYWPRLFRRVRPFWSLGLAEWC
jgi:hypothetical protein